MTTSVISKSMEPACSLGQTHGLAWRVRFQHPIAQPFQHLPAHLPDCLIVFNQQHRFAPAMRDFRRLCSARSLELPRMSGKVELEGRPLPLFAADVDETAVL
jgi:hypothetical protein